MIAIITERARLYYSLVKELKDRKTSFLSLAFDQEIPDFVRVVITSKKERDRVNFPNVVVAGDVQSVVDEAVRISKGQKRLYGELIFGIDPGIKPGLVVLGDKNVVSVQQLSSPESVSPAINALLALYDGREKVIKIGSGSGIYRNRIIKTLQEDFNLPVFIIDEASTTPSVRNSGTSPDIVAAINIALKDGVLVKKRVDVLPKAGEIKNVQVESRVMSKDITISKKLAKRVVKGELTLEEAITLHRNKKARNAKS